MDQSRPRTRGLEASEADEDAKFIKAALKEPEKYIKKATQKLRTDYTRASRKRDNNEDEEEKLFYQQPPFEDEETLHKQVTRRRRGGRRNYRRRGKADGGELEEGTMLSRRPGVTARLTALLKSQLTPRIEPFSGSAIQYKHVWYRLGDIVSVQKDETKYFAQILAFHTDQFCERYASIKWLLPRWKVDLDDMHLPPITVESFQGAVESEELVNLNCFKFILRPPSHHFQDQYPHVVKRDKLYVYQNEMYYFDSPSSTLTSAERRY